MRVSIIIPTYNRAALLPETLGSVFAQTFTDYQAIVVDDGSDDGTPGLLAGLAERAEMKRIAHAGPGAARNAGLALARGEYIAFLDADDLWAPRFLETMTAGLDAAPHAGFVYCDYSTFDESGAVTAAYLPPEHKLRGDLFPTLLEGDFISTGALLVRKSCFDVIGGFDPQLPVAEDWDLWLRLAREFPAEYVDEPLTRIRLDAHHVSRQPELIYTQNLKVLHKLRRARPAEARRWREVLRRQNSRFHRALAGYYRQHGRYFAFVKHATLMLAARWT